MFGFGFGGFNPYNPYARLASFGPAPYMGQMPYGMGSMGGFNPFGGFGGMGGFNPYARIADYGPAPAVPSAIGAPPAAPKPMGPGNTMGGAQPGQGAGAQMYQPGGGAAGFWTPERMQQAQAPGMGAVRPMGPYQAPNMGYVR